MIPALARDFWKWIVETAWPAICTAATRWFKALWADPLMHGVSLAAGYVIARVVSAFL